jgi:hypothetical protein
MGRSLYCIPYNNGGCALSVDKNLMARGSYFIVYSTKPFTRQHFSEHRMKHKTIKDFSV